MLDPTGENIHLLYSTVVGLKHKPCYLNNHVTMFYKKKKKKKTLVIFLYNQYILGHSFEFECLYPYSYYNELCYKEANVYNFPLYHYLILTHTGIN